MPVPTVVRCRWGSIDAATLKCSPQAGWAELDTPPHFRGEQAPTIGTGPAVQIGRTVKCTVRLTPDGHWPASSTQVDRLAPVISAHLAPVPIEDSPKRAAQIADCDMPVGSLFVTHADLLVRAAPLPARQIPANLPRRRLAALLYAPAPAHVNSFCVECP